MSNPVGIYYAYWEKEWSADFIPYIKKVKNLGFDVLEINAGAIADMSSKQRSELAKAAEDNGITLTYCIGLPGQYDVPHPTRQCEKTAPSLWEKYWMECMKWAEKQ